LLLPLFTGNNGKIPDSGDNGNIPVIRNNKKILVAGDNAKIPDTVLVSNANIIIENPMKCSC
jgi:hypothetical protein